jgi:hypothetical protein
LKKTFSEEEIREAIFGSYAVGAPGLDGFSFLFYQNFLPLIKTDFMALVKDFDSGSLDVPRINFSIITLIPKEPKARDLKKFGPISLGNCSLKIITKAITNRIAPIGDRIISQNQTTFLKGRYILESAVAAHEVIHATHSSGDGGLVLKLYCEKAYDWVSWEFLASMLASRGFGLIFRRWVSSFLMGVPSMLQLMTIIVLILLLVKV